MTLFHYWVMTAGAISSLAGMIGILIAFRVMRVNTRHVIRVHDVRSSMSEGIRHGLRIEFMIQLKCVGLPVPSPKVLLQFQSSDGWGSKSYALSPFDHKLEQRTERRPLERGAIGTYAIALPYDFASPDTMKWTLISDFRDPRRQNACIEVYSEEFLVQTIGIRWYEGLKEWWENLAYRINRRFDKHTTAPSGAPGLIPGRVVPVFRYRFRFALDELARMIAESVKAHRVRSLSEDEAGNGSQDGSSGVRDAEDAGQRPTPDRRDGSAD